MRTNKVAPGQQLIVSLPSTLTQGSSAGHGVRVQPEGNPRHDDKQDAGDEVVHNVVTHLPGQVKPHCQRAVVTTCNDRTHCRRFGGSTSLPKYTASRFRTTYATLWLLYETLRPPACCTTVAAVNTCQATGTLTVLTVTLVWPWHWAVRQQQSVALYRLVSRYTGCSTLSILGEGYTEQHVSVGTAARLKHYCL